MAIKDNVRRVQLKFKDVGFGKDALVADLKILFQVRQEDQQGQFKSENLLF